MKMMIINRQHSHLISDKDLPKVELGSMIFVPGEEKMQIVLSPETLTEVGANAPMAIQTVEELTSTVSTGGAVTVTQNIDSPEGFVVSADSSITNNKEISISEDTEGNGVFQVVNGTLTLSGKGTINGVGKNDWNMAIWATENGKVVINDGYFTNVGATANVDPAHFDLIYASKNGQVEINGGEFKCETPKWTLNIKDKDRATASIVVKGGKFHGFNPAQCDTEGENTNFVAPGYKVVETNGIFEVIPE
jgi:hypothetical protein